MKFQNIFKNEKPIIGMIHLAGDTQKDKVSRALDELELYEQVGVDGAIIEDYHGSPADVLETLKQSQGKFEGVVKGINVLRDPYSAFQLACDYGANFIQFDNIQVPGLKVELYNQMRNKYPDIVVLGGVGFKYIPPNEKSLEENLKEGKERCEAIVTTGEGTGEETPIKKLKKCKQLLRGFPLIVGAGVDAGNAHEQLKITDGAIIGSYFKHNSDTDDYIDRERVGEIMDIAKRVRAGSA
jgi:predicted TIM-barrel enzyme